MIYKTKNNTLSTFFSEHIYQASPATPTWLTAKENRILKSIISNLLSAELISLEDWKRMRAEIEAGGKVDFNVMKTPSYEAREDFLLKMISAIKRNSIKVKQEQYKNNIIETVDLTDTLLNNHYSLVMPQLVHHNLKNLHEENSLIEISSGNASVVCVIANLLGLKSSMFITNNPLHPIRYSVWARLKQVDVFLSKRFESIDSTSELFLKFRDIQGSDYVDKIHLNHSRNDISSQAFADKVQQYISKDTDAVFFAPGNGTTTKILTQSLKRMLPKSENIRVVPNTNVPDPRNNVPGLTSYLKKVKFPMLKASYFDREINVDAPFVQTQRLSAHLDIGITSVLLLQAARMECEKTTEKKYTIFKYDSRENYCFEFLD